MTHIWLISKFNAVFRLVSIAMLGSRMALIVFITVQDSDTNPATMGFVPGVRGYTNAYGV